jgi:hypothetical protein
MAFFGSFELRTASDLFRKLEYDLKRVQNNPLDSYAAFDFFVTAEHMIDWFYKDSDGKKKSERNSNSLLQICSHIANGSKHFKATHPRHKAVAATTVHKGDFSQDFSPRDFDVSRLEVELQGDAAAALGNTISALVLAAQITDHWKAKLVSDNGLTP